MIKQIIPFFEIFRYNTDFFLRALDGINDKEARIPAGPDSSPVLWIAGHVISSRYGIVNMLGSSYLNPYAEIFKRGTKFQAGFDYPSLNKLKIEWKSISAEMISVLSSLKENNIYHKPPFEFPVEENNIINGISFFLMHESYHIGQLGYIRKVLGKKWEV